MTSSNNSSAPDVPAPVEGEDNDLVEGSARAEEAGEDTDSGDDGDGGAGPHGGDGGLGDGLEAAPGSDDPAAQAAEEDAAPAHGAAVPDDEHA